MKFRRFLCGLLFGLGCGLSFIGLMAITLPSMQNPRLQLVLSGFEMVSNKPLVETVNQFMRFVLEQNWRVFLLGIFISAVGAILLWQFTRKNTSNKSISKPLCSTHHAYSEAAEKPNPYARVTYHLPIIPEHKQNIFKPEPILERNIIETPAEKNIFSEECQPYFSPRFSSESRAVETEAGTCSQSGSRILLRNMPEKTDDPESNFIYDPPEPAPITSISSNRPSIHMTSPRIRSTMGQHTH